MNQGSGYLGPVVRNPTHSMSSCNWTILLALFFRVLVASEGSIVLRRQTKPTPNLASDGGEDDCISTHFGGEVVGTLVSFETPFDKRYNTEGAIRCFRAYVPPTARRRKGALPVIVYFHEMGSTATNVCRKNGYGGLVKEADMMGYALVCADANVRWDVPAGTKGNEQPCGEGSSFDHAYLRTLLNTLKAWPDWFDLDNIFLAGHSEGSVFSTWAAFCFAKELRGFSPSGMGLKLHGAAVTEALCQGSSSKGCLVNVDDGTVVPQGWGSCKGCEYSPLKPWQAKNVVGEELSACIFSGCQDYFRPTVESMQNLLQEVNMPYKTIHFDGKHVLPTDYGILLSNCFNISNATPASNASRSTCEAQ
mmetsp:Transcript_9007/g.19914  ORF Transcript_9007/g.19914 Transcript_9007/m.19914 type:complete len:363 (+) Transcript_9007:2-1090(+)